MLYLLDNVIPFGGSSMNAKKIFFCIAICALSFSAFAYNPPLAGENLFNFTSPSMLSGEASTTGGSLFQVYPGHISINPAIPAGEQRVVVDAAYTALFASNKNKSYGQAFTAGTMIPSRFGVFTGTVQGVFVPFEDMKLDNSFTIRTAFSKDIFDNLYVGLGLYGTFGTDWGLGADLGFVYAIDTISWLPFMSDIRLAAALTQLGKSYNPENYGVKGISEDPTGFPGMVTPRLGFAGTLFTTEHITSGLSFDFSFPTFQNMVIDTNISFLLFNMLKLSTGTQFNLVETIEDKANYYPSVSLSFKFNFTSDKESLLAKQGLAENEIITSGAFKALNNDVYVASGSAALYLGLEDTQAPEIILWENEE